MNTTDAHTISWTQILNRLVKGTDLTVGEIDWAMNEIMTGSTPEPILASFLTALHMKGESPVELGALARGMLDKAQPITIDRHAVDIVGTGGDRQNTVNISTMAALVIAGAGARVVKHGNRASTSKSGSADVLEKLGVQLDLPVSEVARCANEVGITFLFAMVFHPAMRYVGPTRRQLGIHTAFNYLGPMTNPARVQSSAIGVASPLMAPKMAQVFADRGDHALIFRGMDGLDEISITGLSQLWEAANGQVQEYTFDPQQYGIAYAPIEALRGGDAAHNAEVFHAVLEPSQEDKQIAPIRRAVLLNAAAGLVAYRDVSEGSFTERYTRALEDAQKSIQSGAAKNKLMQWIEFTNSASES